MFHLCQPGGRASCGACCGLYNFQRHDRASLTAALQRHTDALAHVPKTKDAFSAAARALKAQEAAPAFADVRVCPLLGFIEDERVGCLAHPKVTGGADLRDCGVYTADLCESFLCPSFQWLTPAQAEWIRAACPDWYLYGLIITDVELVRALLRYLSREAGEEVRAEQIVACAEAISASGAFFSLKERTAEHADGSAIFGRFVPGQSGEPLMRQLDYPALDARAAPEDDLVLGLGFAPKSAEALALARDTVRQKALRILSAVTATRQTAGGK